jgi:RNA-binding protein
MLTSKKRAELRALAQTEKAIIHIGKNGVLPETETEANNAFNNREIVKGRVLETSPVSADDAATALSEATGSEVLQVVGKVFTLYKKLEEKPAKEKKKAKSSKLTGTKASLKLHPKPRPHSNSNEEDDNNRRGVKAIDPKSRVKKGLPPVPPPRAGVKRNAGKPALKTGANTKIHIRKKENYEKRSNNSAKR